MRSPTRDTKDDKRGFLWLLDEEALLVESSDNTFFGKLFEIKIVRRGADCRR